MTKPRFQLRLKHVMLAVALLAVPMLFLKLLARGDAPVIYMSGDVSFRSDRSIEVRGGAVQVGEGNNRTVIQADRIIVWKGGTFEVPGAGTVRQTPR